MKIRIFYVLIDTYNSYEHPNITEIGRQKRARLNLVGNKSGFVKVATSFNNIIS